MRIAGGSPSSAEPVLVSHEVQLGRGDEGEIPLVGQASVVQALNTAIERAFALGAPTVTVLEGPRGSGKSRLLFLASQHAAHLDPRVHVAYGACREDRDGEYAPFSRMLLERFGVTPTSVPSHVRAQMSTIVSTALATSNVISVAETTHLLGYVAGVPFPDSPFLRPLQANAEELHRRAVAAVRRLYGGDASQRPVLLLLDNFHLAEKPSRDIVAELSRVEGPLAIVLAGDSPVAEQTQSMRPLGGVRSVPIEALSEEHVGEVVRKLLPDLDELPEPLVAALTHRSSGNPSLLRELAFALWENGLFVRSGSKLRVDLARLRDEDMPVSMDDAIRARLARLDGIERATVDRAAVVGEVFWDGAVLAQMRSEQKVPGSSKAPLSIWSDDFDSDALEDALYRLVDKGFLEPAEGTDLPGAREYRFALAGTRKLVYQEMDPERRTRRHGVVARWLSVVAANRREGLAAIVAPHYELAGQRVRAAQAYFEAAMIDRQERRTARALGYSDRALSLLDPEEAALRIEVLHEHGSLLTTLGQYDRAIEAFAEMLSLAWSIGARGKGGAALNRIGRVHRQRGEDAKARETLERALELFRSAADLRGVASTLDDLAQIDLFAGRTAEAIRAALEALDIRRAHGDRRGEALSLTTLGRLELRRGNLAAAETMLRTGLEIRESVGDDEGVLQSLISLGRLLFERGDRPSASQIWSQALARAREMADRRSECHVLHSLAETHLVEGRLDTAQDLLARSREISRELGDRRSALRIELLLGRLAMRRGDDDARFVLEGALALAETQGSKESMAYVHRSLGQLRALTLYDGKSRPGSSSAEDSFLASIDLFREIGNEREAARSLMDLGHHLIERGDLEGARERLFEARAIMRKMGLPEAEHVSRVLVDLGPA